MPSFPDAVWYQLWREVDSEGNYTLDIDQCSFFIQHLFKRILHFFPPVADKTSSSGGRGALFGKTPRSSYPSRSPRQSGSSASSGSQNSNTNRVTAKGSDDELNN